MTAAVSELEDGEEEEDEEDAATVPGGETGVSNVLSGTDVTESQSTKTTVTQSPGWICSRRVGTGTGAEVGQPEQLRPQPHPRQQTGASEHQQADAEDATVHVGQRQTI